MVVALSPQGQVCLSAKPKLLTFLMCACAPSLTRAALGPCWACAPGVVGRRLSNWSLRRNHRKAFLLPRLLGLPSGFLIQQVLGGAHELGIWNASRGTLMFSQGGESLHSTFNLVRTHWLPFVLPFA